MLKNYLVTAWRNLNKNRTFSLINITGLAIGMAVCLLILQYVNFELSYRDNAGTRGDAQGTVPVISFSGTSFTDPLVLYVTLKQVGHVSMGLRAIDNAGNWSMYESEWIIVP